MKNIKQICIGIFNYYSVYLPVIRTKYGKSLNQNCSTNINFPGATQFIIQFMWFKNNNETLPNCRCNRGQKIFYPQNQPDRFSISTDASLPFNSKDIIVKFQRRLNKMNSQDSDHFIFLSESEKVYVENEKLGNLKQTLNDLQSKIAKAKKQLNLYPNILKSQIVQERKDQQVQNFLKPRYQKNLSSIQHNADKQSNTSKQLSLMLFPQMNTHYLSNVQPAVEGKNSRALDHLHMSLKILQNQLQLRVPSFKEIQRFKVNLLKDKRDTDKKTLLIDIDQTLLRCQQKDDKPYDVAVPVRIENGGTAFAYITFRPYAISFLKKMAQKFEIIAFTASHQDYADAVLDEIDPERELIKHRLYRKNCFEIFQNIYAKDLRIVNRYLSQLVLLDNSAFSYIYQLQNAIPILPYYGGQDDEFLKLQKYLQQVAKCDDVRELNKKTFKLHHYPLFKEVDQLVKTLYLKQY